MNTSISERLCQYFYLLTLEIIIMLLALFSIIWKESCEVFYSSCQTFLSSSSSSILIHSANPQSRPVEIIVFTHVVRLSLFFKKLAKQKKFQVIATGKTVGLAEWIIDDICLVSVCNFYALPHRQPDHFPEAPWPLVTPKRTEKAEFGDKYLLLMSVFWNSLNNRHKWRCKQSIFCF